MGKYSLNEYEMRKAIQLLTHVEQKLDAVKGIIEKAQAQLKNQSGYFISNSKVTLGKQADVMQKQMKNIALIRDYMQEVIQLTSEANENAKNVIMSDDLEKFLNEAAAGIAAGALSWTMGVEKYVGKDNGKNNLQETSGAADDVQQGERYTEEEMLAHMRQSAEAAHTIGTYYPDFNGLCSPFTTRQLIVNGVFQRNVDYGAYYGKDYYSTWRGRQTSTGYIAEPFEGSNCLQDILAKYPGQTLRNIVLSFNYDGDNYRDPNAGHVMMIQYIQDGKVYFMESDANLVGTTAPCVKTIEEFIGIYTGANGAIYFHQ